MGNLGDQSPDSAGLCPGDGGPGPGSRQPGPNPLDGAQLLQVALGDGAHSEESSHGLAESPPAQAAARLPDRRRERGPAGPTAAHRLPHHRSDSFVVANPFIAALSLRQILGLGAKAEAPGRLPGCSWVGSGLFHRTKKPTMRPSAVNQSLGNAQGSPASSCRRSANRYSRSQSAASTTGYANACSRRAIARGISASSCFARPNSSANSI